MSRVSTLKNLFRISKVHGYFPSISMFFGCVLTNQYEMLLEENSKNC